MGRFKVDIGGRASGVVSRGTCLTCRVGSSPDAPSHARCSRVGRNHPVAHWKSGEGSSVRNARISASGTGDPFIAFKVLCPGECVDDGRRGATCSRTAFSWKPGNFPKGDICPVDARKSAHIVDAGGIFGFEVVFDRVAKSQDAIGELILITRVRQQKLKSTTNEKL